MAGRHQATFVLDAGVLIGLSRGVHGLRQRIEALLDDGDEVVVPVVVIAETHRGSGPREALLNRALARIGPAAPLFEDTARAGELLADAPIRSRERSRTIDAIVVAEAINHAPAVVLTSGPDDLRPLVPDLVRVIIDGV
jgi:predicted nucleic acid-binding protein